MAEIINMPKLGFDMAEGMLVRWVKNVGEAVSKGEVLAEIETDKATVEVESAFSGVVLQHLVEAGTSVPVNTPIAMVGAAGEKVDSSALNVAGAGKVEAAKVESAAKAETAAAERDTSGEVLAKSVKASPLAKKIARERGVNLGAVSGTGPGGRIVRRDIETALAAGAAPKTEAPAPKARAAEPVSLESVSAADQSIPTSKLRQAIGRRLVESKTSIPHFYVTHEYKMEALMALRQQLNGYLPEGEKLSVNDFIVKGAALALRQFPNLNASLNGAEIVRKGEVNVGVAVTVPGGLLTVVVKHADQKTLRQISVEIKAMAARAREGKVKPEDVDGSTFSTSNLGMYEVEEFIAIINPPEAAILAIGSAKETPVISGGQIIPGWRMKATISVDHRISDGAEAAQFMQALAKYLEEPARMLV